MVNWDHFLTLGSKQLGKPYKFGFKPASSDPSPTHFDCSALVHWLYAHCGQNVPDGSQNQFEASSPVQVPKLGDVGFFRKPGCPTHHVGLYWTNVNVLEARGEPYNAVIYRPVAKWEAWCEFTGWRRFKALI